MITSCLLEYPQTDTSVVMPKKMEKLKIKIQKAKSKLLELITKEKPQKKIIEQIEKIQKKNRKKDKLEDRKAQSSKKKRDKLQKQAEPLKSGHAAKLKQSKKKKKKKGKKSLPDKGLSTSFKAKEAKKKIIYITDEDKLNAFLKGENRKSVMATAEGHRASLSGAHPWPEDDATTTSSPSPIQSQPEQHSNADKQPKKTPAKKKALDESSVNLKATEAKARIKKIDSLDRLESFVKNEKRKTVCSQADQQRTHLEQGSTNNNGQIETNGTQVSTSYSAQDAIKQLAHQKSLEELNHFLQEEKRKTVLSRSEAYRKKLERASKKG